MVTIYTTLERRNGRLVWVERIWRNLFGANPQLLSETEVSSPETAATAIVLSDEAPEDLPGPASATGSRAGELHQPRWVPAVDLTGEPELVR